MADKKLTFEILASRDFRLMLFARMLALSALQAQGVIIGWQIYVLTRDPFLLGLAGLMEAIPAITAALYAGHVVDNSRPQRVYLLCLIGLTCTAAMLFVIGSGIVTLETTLFLVLAYAAIFISGLARAFIMPASFALIAQKVPRKDIPAASAWMSSGFQMAVIVAPALAGIIYGGYGAFAAWTIPVAMLAASVLMMAGIKAEKYIPKEKRERTVESIKAGWQFLVKSPVLLGAMSLDMLAVLFGGAIALLPAFAAEILHIGSEGLGILRAAPAMGAVVISLFMAVRPMKVIKVTTMLWVVAGFGVSMIGFGVSEIFWLSVLCLAASGMFDSVSMVIRHTLVQIMTPDDMRGRVSSVNSMFVISSNEIGAFESGALAKLIGLVQSVVIGGVGTLIVTAGAALLWPDMRKTVIHVADHEQKKD